MGDRTYRIGLLAPFAELPGEYVDVVSEARERALIWQVVTEAVDSHDVDELRALGSHDVLAAGARRLARWRPDIVFWACTSGSFVMGRSGAIEQRDRLIEAAGAPASSTSLAFVDAIRTLGYRSVSLLSPYPLAATRTFEAFLAEWDIEVHDAVHLDRPGARSSEKLDAAAIRPHLETLGSARPILIPDTAVWGFSILREVGGRGVPILVANQVTLWQVFRMLGMATDLESFGVLRSIS